MSITEKRLERIDFSGPYRVSIGQFVGKKDGGLKLFNDNGQVNPAGFKGIRLGLERSTTYEEWVKANVPDAEIVYYDGNEPMYLDLAAERVDVIMTNPMKAYLKFLSKDGNDRFDVIGPQLDDPAYFGTGVGIGLRKGQDDLKGRINSALEGMTNDGALNEFSLRYFPFPIYPQQWRGAS
jgi:polar amino acid transport system substrate-binding protein